MAWYYCFYYFISITNILIFRCTLILWQSVYVELELDNFYCFLKSKWLSNSSLYSYVAFVYLVYFFHQKMDGAAWFSIVHSLIILWYILNSVPWHSAGS